MYYKIINGKKIFVALIAVIMAALSPLVISSAWADNIVGSDDDDILPGTNDDDSIWGLDGDDVMWGKSGEDNLYGHESYCIIGIPPIISRYCMTLLTCNFL